MTTPTRLQYNTLDVFTTTPFSGNQLGLVHIPSGTNIPHSQKQQITIEFNYSESVFINHTSTETESASYDVQIFTPKSELPFAGHPTIGTAVWIFENVARERDEVTIQLKAGPVRAVYDRVRGIARCAIPHNVRVHWGTASWDRVVQVQTGLRESAGPTLRQSRTPFVSPVQGMAFALVDLSSQPELLGKVVVTKDDIPTHKELDAGWQEGLLGDIFYCIQVDKGDGVIRLRQRVMTIELEDPATGAASAALTAYLALVRGGAGQVYQFEIDQGIEMGRASKIFVEVKLNSKGGGVEELVLKGQAVEVMSGQLRVQQ